MEEIFHERQEGSLCAQHCLNALLQAHYFTAVELGTLARQMDDEERSRMAEGGIHSEDYHRFLQQPSNNVDDSGYFSVQVIASALKVWGLELIPYSSQNPLAQSARRDPTTLSAYICNFVEHWITVRKIGYQWFNLNSLLMGPELISDTFLALYLAQLQEDGYSIFIVDGKLPDCSADRILRLQPAVQTEKPRLIAESKGTSHNENVEESKALSDRLKLTLEESLQIEDDCMQAALSMSLNEFQRARASGTTSGDVSRNAARNSSTVETNSTDMDKNSADACTNSTDADKNATRINKDSANIDKTSTNGDKDSTGMDKNSTDTRQNSRNADKNNTSKEASSEKEMTEQEMLEAAIKMSMES